MDKLALVDTINITIPDNKYEQIIYLEGMNKQLADMQDKITEYVAALKEELTGDETDDTYHLVDVFDARKTTVIDVEGLVNAGLYDKCMSITGANAMKLIGEDKMLQLCLKYAGESRTNLASSITLKKMKKVLTEDEYKQFTSETYKKVGVAVEKK